MKLTIEQAQSAMTAAMVKAAAIDVPMSIVVIDASGRLKGFLRMDDALLGSIDIALRKANTSLLFGANSESVWDYCKPGGPAPGLEHTNHVLVTFAGGVPLCNGDEVVGAVGVSGGAVSEDAEVAAAAALAFGTT